MMKLLLTAACAAMLAVSPAIAQQIQTGTPRDTNTAPSLTNQGTAQPADTNPSTERQTGTAGSAAEQARSGAQGVTVTQPTSGQTNK